MENSITHTKTNDPNFSVETGSTRESWKVLFENLYADISKLYERERLLVRTEVKEKIDHAKKGVGAVAVGVSILLVGLFSLVATAIFALHLVMPLWAAALIVTGILILVGGILFLGGKQKLESDQLFPRQSIETLGEIKNTFQEHYHEFSTHKH